MNVVTIRRWHSYAGLFIAPSVLFFALTGAAQVFSLHEAHGSYTPPALVEKLSSVHKDQVFAMGHHPPAEDAPKSTASEVQTEPAAQPSQDHEEHEDEPRPGTVLLKWYFLVVAIVLTLSTAFGVWMGLKYAPRKKLSWALLFAGTLIPAILTAL